MDTIPESAATTLVRIEVIVLQGILRAALLALASIAIIPLRPFVFATARFGYVNYLWWQKVLCIPWWLLIGVLIAIVSPFMVLFRGMKDTVAIAKVEWKERWRYGRAKYPDGRPMSIPSIAQAQVDAAITKSVIEDYNDEAISHGQGIPAID